MHKIRNHLLPAIINFVNQGAARASVKPRGGLTDIHDLRVLHDELVHGNGRNPEEYASDNHGDDSRNPAQDAKEMAWSVSQKLSIQRSQTYESDHV